MSTKSSRRFEMDEYNRQGFHLYDECFDEDGNVYLELKGFQFEASTSGSLSADGVPRLTVKLPLAWAEKLGLIRVPDSGSIAPSEGGVPPNGAMDGH
jgi:hypothetical protein